MRHVIDLPQEIERALEKRASETGDEVNHLIEMAVAAFVRNGAEGPSRRKLDPPTEAAEIDAPCDLPRSKSQFVAIAKRLRRIPDPVADPT